MDAARFSLSKQNAVFELVKLRGVAMKNFEGVAQSQACVSRDLMESNCYDPVFALARIRMSFEPTSRPCAASILRMSVVTEQRGCRPWPCRAGN
jgi:hypothetical protein